MLSWSPDSKALVAFRIEPGDNKEVHLIESSPRGGGRAVLHSRPYPLPGDKFTAYELHLFDVASKKANRVPTSIASTSARPRYPLEQGRRHIHLSRRSIAAISASG